MAHGYPSHLRTARIIQEIIAPVVAGLVDNGIVTVQTVEVSPDRRYATINYTIRGADPATTHDLLKRQLPFLRATLAKGMHAKRVPNLALLQLPLEMPELPCTDS